MASRLPGSARGGSSPPSLVLPFAVLGLAGGWLTADAFHVRHELEPVRWLLAFFSPLVAAALGVYLGPRLLGVATDGGAPPAPAAWLARGWLAGTLWTLLAIAVAGLINGMLIGLLLVFPVGALFGAFFGVLCAVPFLPALAAVILAARRVGRARAGSMVDASDRRAVWLAVAAVTVAGCLLGPIAWPPSPAEREALALVRQGAVALAGAVIAWSFVMDAAALVRLTKAGRSERAGTEAWREGGGAGAARQGQAEGLGVDADSGQEALEGALAVAAADGAEVVDLGLGDEVRVEAVPAAHAYRGARRVRQVVRGSRERATAALRGGMARAALALAAGAALWARPWG